MTSTVYTTPAGSNVNFDCLYIVESLTPTEAQTGSELHRYLTVTKPVDKLRVELRRVETADAVLGAFAEIAEAARQGACMPMLHIEAHGSSNGMTTTSSEWLAWGEFTEPLRAINIATRNALVVAMAVCKGIYLSTVAAMNPFQPAPFCGVVGPDKNVNSYLLMHGFRAFYGDLLKTASFQSALHELQMRSLPEYRAFDTGDVFRKGWAHYMSTLSGPAFDQRVETILVRTPNDTIERFGGIDAARKHVVQQLRNNEERRKRYWRHFVMADAFPENEERFRSLEPAG